MDRAEYWRTSNDPHSPTHRSPQQSPRALADIGLEECGGAQHRYIRQMMQQFQGHHQDQVVEVEGHNPSPGVRFQDDRGAAIRRREAMYHHDNNTTTTTSTTINITNNNNDNNSNNSNNNNNTPQTPLYTSDNLYESTESSSSLSSPLSSSGRTPRYQGFEVNELKFSYHGQKANDNDDDEEDDEENSVVTRSTINDEQQAIRSALSSLNNNSAWGSVWDEFQPEYKLLHDSYQTKKQEILKIPWKN
ncbi:hypothetical protein BDC45DRAFT_255740 [Circinella umbellata]|nr:hypothetical protein BDC45DRAFT_255740 [Circinella umbellata]